MVQQQCAHHSGSECVCGLFVAVDRVELWNAISDYVLACGGDPSKYVGSPLRMKAVCRVENAVRNRKQVTNEIGRWVVR